MAQKKLQRFEDIKSFQNVLQYPENMPGKWNTIFGNNNFIILELACGKGEYTIELAQKYPHKNFIGADLKGNRIWVGAKQCINKNILNAAFLRTQIDKINNYFAREEVEEIWITFPDPHLRKSKAKKRLTHPKFLRLYKQFLKADGCIHLKTDSPDLYNFTKNVINLYELKIITDIDDVYKNEDISPDLKIKTYYESLNISGSNRVFYISFMLPDILNDDDSDLQLLLNNENLAKVMSEDFIENKDFYFDENGCCVLTEKYLIKRGDCCGNGCRHCPYNYKNVAEPGRSTLLASNKLSDKKPG